MAATISAVSPPRTARRSRICSSRSIETSVGMGQLFGMMRLVQKDLERGEVGVPLDQRGHGAEAPERRGVKIPDGLGNPRAVIVDQNVHVLGGVMAAEVDFTDRFDRQRVEVVDWVEPEVPRADMDVVDVAEYAAACSTGDFGDEFRLGYRRMAVAEIGGRVLDQQPPAERLLRLLDVPAEELEARFGIGQRQQVVEIGSGDRAPRQMLGDEHRLDPLDQRLEAAKMPAIELLGASQGQGDAVKAHRVVTPQLKEPIQRGRVGHVVLGMDLEKADWGPGGRDLRHVRRAQAYTHAAVRDWSTLGHDRGPARSFWLGSLEAAAGDFRTGAYWDVDPGIRVAGLLGFTGAGMRRGLAVVLRRRRNAKALFGRELRRWRRPCAGEKRQCDDRGESGGCQ